jgi:hypothetical protein
MLLIFLLCITLNLPFRYKKISGTHGVETSTRVNGSSKKAEGCHPFTHCAVHLPPQRERCEEYRQVDAEEAADGSSDERFVSIAGTA